MLGIQIRLSSTSRLRTEASKTRSEYHDKHVISTVHPLPELSHQAFRDGVGRTGFADRMLCSFSRENRFSSSLGRSILYPGSPGRRPDLALGAISKKASL